MIDYNRENLQPSLQLSFEGRCHERDCELTKFSCLKLQRLFNT